MNIKKLITEYLSPALARAVAADMSDMESALTELCRGAGDLSSGLTRINRAGGKRLRPLLARVCMEAGPERGRIVPLMTMLELMHTTSLIHDDYVDGAALRRGVATINASGGWDAAMRSGDYLLACAMEYLKLYRGTGINEVLSDVSQEMCIGELDQHAGLNQIAGFSTEDYFRRIRRKTALLMSASCRCGAIAGGAEEAICSALADYGLQLGIAFQLQDDLKDCLSQTETGKPQFQDLRSGVITLPVLLTAQKIGADFAALIEMPEKSEADIRQISSHVAACGAIDNTITQLQFAVQAAQEALAALPDGEVREILTVLAQTISEVK